MNFSAMVKEVGRFVCEVGRLLLLQVVVRFGWQLVESFLGYRPARSNDGR